MALSTQTAAGQTHSAPLGAYWACAARQEAGVRSVERGLCAAIPPFVLQLIQPSEGVCLGGGGCVSCAIRADTPQWSVCVYCVIEGEWGVKPPPTSTEQVVIRLCQNLRPLLPLRLSLKRPTSQTITAEACHSCRVENKMHSDMASPC